MDKKTYTIAIMSGSIQSNYVQEMKKGFSLGGRDNHVNTIFFTGSQIPRNCTGIVNESIAENCKNHFSTIYQYVHFIKPDAVIITYGSLSALLNNKDKSDFFKMLKDIPCVMVEDEFPEYGIPSITADNYGGMRECVSHLIDEHGFKKIAYLSGPKGNYDSDERLRAYYDVMKEHNLTVTDQMVAFGDFSEYRDEQIITLLDENPDLEAICCADDMIAKGVYRILENRNLVIGKDIAITGFDDSDMASSMNPPLTSVSQNVFEMGYYAIGQAVALCKGEKVSSIKMPTTLRKRASCNCKAMGKWSDYALNKDEMIHYLVDLLHNLSPRFFETIHHSQEESRINQLILDYCTYLAEHVFLGNEHSFSLKSLRVILKELLSINFFFKYHLIDGIIQFLTILRNNTSKKSTGNILDDILSDTQSENLKYNIQTLENNILEKNSKNWFIPLFIGNLIKDLTLAEPEKFFTNIMNEMKNLSFKKSYFLLFDEITYLDIENPMKYADHMHLLSYFNEKEMKYFHKSPESKINYENGFTSFIKDEEPMELSMVVLFADQKQYGLLLCDVSDNDLGFVQICGIQLGNLFNFVELNNTEQIIRKELQSSLKIIREQNEILDFLSRYDELTNLYNRRGFIEQVIKLHNSNPGKKAYMIISDLDHLKEINDIYGHIEGDFAIRTIATRFINILPDNAIIGRLGGDEFVAFVLSDDPDFTTKTRTLYKKYTDDFNNNNKPYFIEASFGIHEFICSSKLDLDDIIKKADNLLYQEKSHRRLSIVKKIV